MKDPVLSYQLPQEDAKGINVYSQCDRVLLGPLHGVLVLANSTQHLWGRIARVPSLHSAAELRRLQMWTFDSGHLDDRAGTERLPGCIA